MVRHPLFSTNNGIEKDHPLPGDAAEHRRAFRIGVSQNQMSSGHLQSGERPDRDVRAGMNHQGRFRGASLPWRYHPASRPCEAFAMTVGPQDQRSLLSRRGSPGNSEARRGPRRGKEPGVLFFGNVLSGQAKERYSRSSLRSSRKKLWPVGREIRYRNQKKPNGLLGFGKRKSMGMDRVTISRNRKYNQPTVHETDYRNLNNRPDRPRAADQP